MTRLFILQVLLFSDWFIVSNGEDASEEPSQDRFVLHIPVPIPVTTSRNTHAVFKITQNDGKKHHNLEIYQPVLHNVVNSHHYKSSFNHKNKKGSKKRSRQHSNIFKNEQKNTKKVKHPSDESNEEQHQHHLNYGYGQDFENQEPEDRLKELFDHYFRADRKFKHNVKVNQERLPGFVFRHSSRAGRSQNSKHDLNQYSNDYYKWNIDDNLKQKQRSKRPGRLKNNDYGQLNRDEESDTGTRAEKGDNYSNFPFKSSSINHEPVATKKPLASINKELPKLHPNWADEGLISPFALNDVLFKDKRYNKKVFKELGWYPLFLPYEVIEEQEKR